MANNSCHIVLHKNQFLIQGLIVIISVMVVIIVIMFATIETPCPFLHSTPLHSLCTPNIFSFVLIPATMALHTNLVVVDAFLHMLLTNLGAGVLVAAVAGIAGVVVFYVTVLAVRPMVLIETEVLFMLEGRRGPALLDVT